MRISVIYNNGRRVKLAPKAAHQYLWNGWAEIAPEDAEGAKLYVEYLKELHLNPGDRTRPDDLLPAGYEIHRGTDVQGLKLVVLDPDGESIDRLGFRNMASAIAAAHRHAGAPAIEHEEPEKLELDEEDDVDDEAVEEALEESDPLAEITEQLPEGYAVEYNRGWYKILDSSGVQVGGATRDPDEAVLVAIEDSEAEEEDEG